MIQNEKSLFDELLSYVKNDLSRQTTYLQIVMPIPIIGNFLKRWIDSHFANKHINIKNYIWATQLPSLEIVNGLTELWRNSKRQELCADSESNLVALRTSFNMITHSKCNSVTRTSWPKKRSRKCLPYLVCTCHSSYSQTAWTIFLKPGVKVPFYMSVLHVPGGIRQQCDVITSANIQASSRSQTWPK